MESPEAGAITACVLALVILILFVVMTWLKWRKNVAREMANNGANETLTRQDGNEREAPRITINHHDVAGNQNLAANLKSMEDMTGSSSLLNEKTAKRFYPGDDETKNHHIIKNDVGHNPNTSENTQQMTYL